MPGTITVLLIEDDSEYVTLVQSWLASSKDVEIVVSRTATLLEGVDRIAEGGIDVILLDLSLPDSNGPETFHVVRTHAREIPIVLLSGDDSGSLALDLVSAGAQDYLVKSSCRADILIRAIMYALIRHPRKGEASAESGARIVGLLSAKGGVGTTTLACVLAAELRHVIEREVLLVDLDLHSNAASFLLGMRPVYSLLDALENLYRLDESCWRSMVCYGPENVHVLPSPVLQGHDEPEREKLRQLLNRLSIYYGWIVLDLGRLNSFSRIMLDSVDQTVVLSSTTLASLHQARQIVASLRTAGWEGDRLRLAVTELPGDQGLPEVSLAEMVGLPVALHLPESSIDLKGAAANEHLPKKGSRYRESVARFSRVLTGLPEQKPTNRRLAQMLGWR